MAYIRTLATLGLISALAACTQASSKESLTPLPALNPATPAGTLTVHVDRPGVKISPMLYGLMTEEINHSYDGGLYAELIQNRIFADANRANPLPHWSLINAAAGNMALDTIDPVNTIALKNSLRLTINTAGERVGVANDGFWGIPVKPSTTYTASFYAKASADFAGALSVSIESNDGKIIAAHAKTDDITPQWKKYTVTLTTTADATPSTTNRFVISANHTGSVSLSLVSLFPPTYNNRPYGNRTDLMEALNGMKPAFLRFPGGNYLEGDTIPERFDWKKTIGPLEDRPGHQCPWGYRSSDGMGLMEFLIWCEDNKMEPLLAVYGGYSLQQKRILAGPALDPYVLDALDEIEYVTGDVSTPWGARRAADGHPAPFRLTFVEVGNEDNYDKVAKSYDGRFAQFFKAIKAKYPALQVIATMPVNSVKPDVVDDHYYRSARAMENDVHHYDTIDRSGPKIFVGEWASTEGSPTPTLNAALGDAAWMTGLERNSDLVLISCYAPLLVNVNKGARQWGTNLIGYDALHSFGSPSYYAQCMFAKNRGDTVLPVDITAPATQASVKIPAPHGAVGVATWGTAAEFQDLKVAQEDKVLFTSDFNTGSAGFHPVHGTWSTADNSLKQTSTDTDCRDTVGDTRWSDYNFTLKARKISGKEGFIIQFNSMDDDNFMWFNVGGWGNSYTSIEVCENGAKREIGNRSNFTVQPNRQYSIRVETKGNLIRCYIDDQLIASATYTPELIASPLYATASRVDSTGEVIVKVVNVSPIAQPMNIHLAGITSVGPTTIETLTGNPADVNTLDNPKKIIPTSTTYDTTAPTVPTLLPPHSVSILRMKAK